METETFSIHKELREACDRKELSEVINTFLSNEKSMLCVDCFKQSITLEECKNSKEAYYFFQNYTSQSILCKSIKSIDTSRPFLVIERKALPSACPLQPGKHVVYICNP